MAPTTILTPRHWKHLWPSLNGLCALEMWVNIFKCDFIDSELLKGSFLISGECKNYENFIQGNLWRKRKELVPSRALLIRIPKWALGSNNHVLEFPVRHFFFFFFYWGQPVLLFLQHYVICSSFALWKINTNLGAFPDSTRQDFIWLHDVEAHTYPRRGMTGLPRHWSLSYITH